ncbi:hypothetical protein [Nonomuraea angiospora]
MFENSSFDERALPVILAVHSGTPSEDELEGAALIEYDPAPATLESTARWMSIRDGLTAEGFTPTEILRVFLRVVSLAYNMPGPTTEMLARMFAEVSGTEVPREVCEHLIALGKAPVPPGARRWHLDQAGAIAAARLACDGDLDPGFDRLLVEAIVPLPVVRAALAALPMERREALVLSTMDRMNFAADMLGWLLDTRDLVDTPAVAAARTRLINQAPGSDGMQALIAEESRGTPRPLHPRPTPAAPKGTPIPAGQARRGTPRRGPGPPRRTCVGARHPRGGSGTEINGGVGGGRRAAPGADRRRRRHRLGAGVLPDRTALVRRLADRGAVAPGRTVLPRARRRCRRRPLT